MALNPPITKKGSANQEEFSTKFTKNKKGGSFCQVNIKNIGTHPNPLTTLGTQKCIGKTPSLITSLKAKIHSGIPPKSKGPKNIRSPPHNKRPLPIA
jgi:hypothetical protein